MTGECECDKQHEGEKCQNCRAGFYSAGGRSEEQRCEACGCVVENTLGGVLEECSYSGQCSCKGGLVFVDDRTCQTCPPGQVINGNVVGDTNPGKMGIKLTGIILVVVLD